MQHRILVYRMAPDAFARLDFSDDAAFLHPLLLAAARQPEPGRAIERSVLAPTRDGRAEIRDFTVYTAMDLLLQTYTPEEDQSVLLEVVHDEAAMATLAKALNALEALVPAYWRLLQATTRGFVFSRQERLRSFATEALHGISFLSLPKHVSVPGLTEDVAHQCGHTLFSSMFPDPAPWDQVRASAITGQADDRRSAYVVFHGVFTESLIALALITALETGFFELRDRHEAEGRLAFLLRKFASDLSCLMALSVDPETEWGRIRGEMKDVFADVVRRARGILRPMDLDGHGYDFDAQVFFARNTSDDGHERAWAIPGPA